MVVYGEPDGIDSYDGGALTAYYACLRPKGRPVAIGETADSGGEYPGNEEMQDLRIAGVFVADESAAGFASAAACVKFEPPSSCNNIVKYWIKIADAAERRTVKVNLPGPVNSLRLSSAGPAAWVISTASSSSGPSHATLYAIAGHPPGRGWRSAKPQVIDSGTTITSVSFAGSSLRWRNAGQPKRRRFPDRGVRELHSRRDPQLPNTAG